MQETIVRYLAILVLIVSAAGVVSRAQEKLDAPAAKTVAMEQDTAEAQTQAQTQSTTPPTPQNNAQSAASTSANIQDPNKPDADRDAKDAVPKRIFFIIPNFMTANDQPENQGPLTTKEKYNIAWHQFFDVSAHFGNLIQASISQGLNSIPHYGQGWGAFGERMAAQEGDQFTGSMLIYGVLPQIFHQDPRYFRKGKGRALSRVGYAASRVLIARSDAGNSMFNVSQVFGQLGQAGISLSYYPHQDRNVTGLFSGWAINQIYNIGWNQLKEFTPDLGAYIQRHSKKNKGKQVHDSRCTIPSDH